MLRGCLGRLGAEHFKHPHKLHTPLLLAMTRAGRQQQPRACIARIHTAVLAAGSRSSSAVHVLVRWNQHSTTVHTQIQQRSLHALTGPREWLLKLWKRRPKGMPPKKGEKEPLPPPEVEEYLSPWHRRQPRRRAPPSGDSSPPPPPPPSRSPWWGGAGKQHPNEPMEHPNYRNYRPRDATRGGQQGRQQQGQQQPPPEGEPPRRFPFFELLVPSVIFLLLSVFVSPEDRTTKTITWQEFYAKMLSQGEVSRLVMDRERNTVHVYLHEGAIVQGFNDKNPSQPLPKFQINVPSVASFERQVEVRGACVCVSVEWRVSV